MNDSTRPVVGKIIQLKFPQLGNLVLDAKIDSGAGQSSLHADDIKSSGESVSFVLEGKRITMNQAGKAEIRTADNGGDARPVIKLDVECEHGSFKGVEFNLNDRSDMPDKVLLGHNFFELGNFVIDPLKENEESDTEESELVQKDEELTQLYVIQKNDGYFGSVYRTLEQANNVIETGDKILEVVVNNIKNVE